MTAIIVAAALGLAALGLWLAQHIGRSIDAATDVRADDELDACDDCRTPLVEATRAITCGAHSLCVGCNADHNPCCECAYWAADAEANGSNL